MKVFNNRTDKIPPDAIYVGRPSEWGNDMTLRELRKMFPDYTLEELYQEAVNWFRRYAMARLEREPDWLKPLKGHDLVCWCKPLPCHADVLLELANKEV